jgi:hypothetical protein
MDLVVLVRPLEVSVWIWLHGTGRHKVTARKEKSRQSIVQ